MMNWIYKIGGMIGAAAVWLLYTLHLRRSRDRARDERDEHESRADSAEHVVDSRKRADDANEKAKENGDAELQDAVDRARAGRRDHFE